MVFVWTRRVFLLRRTGIGIAQAASKQWKRTAWRLFELPLVPERFVRAPNGSTAAQSDYFERPNDIETVHGDAWTAIFNTQQFRSRPKEQF